MTNTDQGDSFSLVPTFYASSVMACRFYSFLRDPIVGSSLWLKYSLYCDFALSSIVVVPQQLNYW